jgi:hypothetical protein
VAWEREDVTKTLRLVALAFSGVRSYEWDLPVPEVSGDLACTVLGHPTEVRDDDPKPPDQVATA